MQIFRMFFVNIVLLLYFNYAYTLNYCDKRYCPAGERHIACKNDASMQPACKESGTVLFLSKSERKFIVKLHNEFRNQVARGGYRGVGQALRMGIMRWNHELAFLAELNVRQCELKRSKCFTTVEFPMPGQNLAYNQYQGEQDLREILKSQIIMWFNERNQSNANDIIYGNGTAIHYLQMVRDRADQIGCAVVQYHADSFKYQYFTCKYSSTATTCPPVYQIGAIAGDKCKTNTDRIYTNLCSDKEIFDYEECIDPSIVTDEPEIETTEKYTENTEELSTDEPEESDSKESSYGRTKTDLHKRSTNRNIQEGNGLNGVLEYLKKFKSFNKFV